MEEAVDGRCEEIIDKTRCRRMRSQPGITRYLATAVKVKV